MKRIRDLFRRQPRSVGDDPTFITLVRVAREDPDIGAQLFAILSLETFHRQSALNTLIEQMRLRQVPEAFVAAVAHLLDDAVADRVRRFLENDR